MAAIEKVEIYAILVHLNTGTSIEGYVQRGADTEDGSWLIISRNQGLNEATYINRQMITHFELAEIK